MAEYRRENVKIDPKTLDPDIEVIRFWPLFHYSTPAKDDGIFDIPPFHYSPPAGWRAGMCMAYQYNAIKSYLISESFITISEKF